MTVKDIWNGAAGGAVLPTVCRVKGLRSYHPMRPTQASPYNVELRTLKIDSVEIPGKYVLKLKLGWTQEAINHVNYRKGETLIFEKGDKTGNFLVATPPVGISMDIGGKFLLKRWEIHVEQTSPDETEFLDLLTWETISANKSEPAKQFVTSWRWKNDG
ncbi:MAG: hypothetical protein ACI9WC_001493 [Arenicella sp.]|jgi:hypothetical protein